VTRKPSGPTGRMATEKGPTGTRDVSHWVPQVQWRRVQVTRKPSGLIGRIEMEKGPIGTCDTQAIGSHGSDGDGERSHRYT
jgi:hypothetical protein